MGWNGAMMGLCIGSLFSPLGAVLGAIAGYHLENKFKKRPAKTSRKGHAQRPFQQDSGAASAYSVLGVSPSASNEELRKAYRVMAKRCHPDVLRSQGATEEAIARASQRMSAINAAWNEIKKARGV